MEKKVNAQDKFVKKITKKATELNRDYDFSFIKYTGCNNKVKVWCNKHQEFFEIVAQYLVDGNGCKKCGAEAQYLTVVGTLEKFLEKALLAHEPGHYSYEKVIYKNMKTKVEIVCNYHQISFWIKPLSHVYTSKSGCRICANESISKKKVKNFADAKQEAASKYGLIYEYDESTYVGSTTPMKMSCTIHGYVFWQSMHYHITETTGCLECRRYAGGSLAESNWLDFVHVPQEQRSKAIKLNGKLLKPDGLDVENKIWYEFYGSLFHGEPNTVKNSNYLGSTPEELFIKTIEREKLITRNGFKIISIWESKWRLLEKEYVKIRQLRTAWSKTLPREFFNDSCIGKSIELEGKKYTPFALNKVENYYFYFDFYPSVLGEKPVYDPNDISPIFGKKYRELSDEVDARLDVLYRNKVFPVVIWENQFKEQLSYHEKMLIEQASKKDLFDFSRIFDTNRDCAQKGDLQCHY